MGQMVDAENADVEACPQLLRIAVYRTTTDAV